MKNFKVVDLFAGAGGETTGIIQAGKYCNRKIDLLAINHWEIAIETHSKNYPQANHLCESIEVVDPIKAVPGKRLNLLWASPECTHHSRARGGRPCSNQKRASAWLILKWLQELYIDHVIIENVPDFISWGPLDAYGRSVKRLRGKTFQAFVNALRSLNYRVEWKVLNAANYGTPTTRERLFIQARRVKGRIVWPEISHSSQVNAGFFKQNIRPWIPARDVIDWSIPGNSIFNRKRPLQPATLKRIEYGIQKYWGEWAEPFLIILRGASKTRSINEPVPTISSGGGHVGLVEPFITTIDNQSTRDGNNSLKNPLSTIVTKARHCIVEPFILHQMTPGRPRGMDEPLPTIMAKNGHALVEPFLVKYNGTGKANSINEPVGTVTANDRFGIINPFLVKLYGTGKTRPIHEPLDTVTGSYHFAIVQGDPVLLDIRFRMLLPHELAAAQGFPVKYWFAGNKADQVRQIGNAVPPPFARALTESYLNAA